MSKKERKLGAKRREDPGQQQKSGAVPKPTMVKTDRKVRKEDMDINEMPTRRVRVQVLRTISVTTRSSPVTLYVFSLQHLEHWSSVVKVEHANWSNSSKNEEFIFLPEFSDVQINAMRKASVEVEVIDEKCGFGYEKGYENHVW